MDLFLGLLRYDGWDYVFISVNLPDISKIKWELGVGSIISIEDVLNYSGNINFGGGDDVCIVFTSLSHR